MAKPMPAWDNVIIIDGANAAELTRLFGIEPQPGYHPAAPFTRRQFPGAIPNGTRIKKVLGEPGDKHSLGARGVVLGSIQPLPGSPIGYFIEWDDQPRIAALVMDKKIGRADG